MKALVTGASGFLGGRLTEVLLERGTEVTILARPSSDLSRFAGLRFSGRSIQVLSGGLASLALQPAELREITHIYHCAGCSTDWAPWQTYYETNVAGTRALLVASLKAPCLQRFVHVSTTDIYGYPEHPCDESHPGLDTGLPYNRSKLQGEAAVWQAHRHGLPITILRPATIYGPHGKAFTTDIAALLRQRSMALIDSGRTHGGFCYVDNAVDALLASGVSEATIGKAYNIADGAGATWRDYVCALADGLGLPHPWINLPRPAAMALAGVLEAPYKLLPLPGRPLLTRHAVELLSRDQEYPTARAERDFSLSPAVSFAEGIARSVAWLKRAP